MPFETQMIHNDVVRVQAGIELTILRNF